MRISILLLIMALATPAMAQLGLATGLIIGAGASKKPRIETLDKIHICKDDARCLCDVMSSRHDGRDALIELKGEAFAEYMVKRCRQNKHRRSKDGKIFLILIGSIGLACFLIATITYFHKKYNKHINRRNNNE